MAQRYKVVAEWIVGSLAEADRRTEALLDTGEVDTISITALDHRHDSDHHTDPEPSPPQM
ncbi:hypothetical protein AD006_30210 (plasmid) [Pseudonocardia sp. EC080610-09]|nr:hypothetical protein AD006_30210 [Pseudonocardia sp. EC080610-09]ALL85538.1 hypothetical protein AD017_31040 [Pseudonocardia sp. EC080619-01]